jgi:hypothetical protein
VPAEVKNIAGWAFPSNEETISIILHLSGHPAETGLSPTGRFCEKQIEEIKLTSRLVKTKVCIFIQKKISDFIDTNTIYILDKLTA